jgi:hypothetical protein
VRRCGTYALNVNQAPIRVTTRNAQDQNMDLVCGSAEEFAAPNPP